MIELKSNRSRVAAYAGAVVLVIGIIFFLLRGPYLSNYIKRIIVPQLENITRERVMIDKAVINLFPFYVQAKGLKMFDKDGNKLLWVTKTRAYIDLTPLLAGEIRVRKLTIREPDLTADENDLKRIAVNVKKSSSIGDEGRFRVSLKNIELTDGRLNYADAAGSTGISGKGVFISMVTKRNEVTAELRFRDCMLKLPNGSDLLGGFEMKAMTEDGKINIKELNVRSSRSALNMKGSLLVSDSGAVEGGSFEGGGKIYGSTLSEAFGLQREEDGVLSFDGSVHLVPGKDPKRPDVVLDLRTDSSFYLETLMAMIGVKQNISGLVSVKGEIKGRFPEVVGKGYARLEKSVFGTLPLDDAAGEIEYREGRFTLHDFKAHAYEGELDGYAHIEIEDGDYAVTADVRDINSLKLFKYIGWEPPFPAGRVSGDFMLNHDIAGLEIAADVDYLNDEQDGTELTERIRTITTSLKLKGDMLTFGDTVFYTSRSKLFLKGGIDFEQDTLSLDLMLETKEINDLTKPYYNRLNTAGTFTGKAEGLLAAPEISGNLYLDGGSLHGIPVSGAFAALTYKIDSLAVEKLKLEQNASYAEVTGSIEFREAENIFSFKSPYFKGSAALQDAGIKQFADLFSRELPVEGTASGTITFEGDTEKFTGTGDLVITDAVVDGQDISKVELKAAFGPELIEFHPITLYHGESILAAEGKVYYDGNFDLALSSHNLDTCDINVIADHPLGLRFGSLKISGSGTIENPDLKFSGHIIESYLNEKEIGSGDVEGTFKGRNLAFKGDFAGGLLSVKADASFSGEPSWNADIDIRKGKYDFLLSGLIDKTPEDLSLILKGELKVRSAGDGHHAVQSKLDYLGLEILGYELANDKDVVLEILNNELFIKALSLKGDNTDVYASGSVRFNESYDVVLIGNVDISPFSSVSEMVGSIKGYGAYIMNIAGDWNAPEIKGEISVKDTTVVLKDMTYMIGPMNGDFIFDGGKVTFDSVRTGFAGGIVDISGVGYLNKLSVEKLYVSASLSDIKVRPMERVNVSLGGRLFYETSPEGSSFTGNIDINKAKYEKDVKFDKLILGLREMESKKVQYPEFIRETALNIHVQGKENIVIDNNIATTPVSISMNLTGSVGKYGLMGKVDALGGTIYFRNNEFTILKGSSVEFISSESVVPVFHILAESFISDYYIKLRLDGTMDQFNLSLFSDPPLSETDILTLLTFGQFKKGVKGFESGLAASEAASILTGDLQEAVESKFRNLTGFDRFEIEPHTAASGAFGPKVTIGKRLIEDKLSVIYSTSVGTTEEHIIKLKYNISKSVAVIGSRDEIGSTGVDLKYRFEFK